MARAALPRAGGRRAPWLALLAAFGVAALSACGIVAGLDGLTFVPACTRDADCDDGDACTLDACDREADGCTHAPAPSGTPCGEAGDRRCDGEGTCVACLTDAECTGARDECRWPACRADHTCGVAFAEAGTPLTAQTRGDCHVVVCDGEGAAVDLVDDTDIPNDGNDCTDDGCADGATVITNRAAGELCGADKDLVCDGAGTCGGCTQDAQCTPPDTCGGGGMPWACGCTPLLCDPARTCGTIADQGCGLGPLVCDNLTKDNDEADVDCGGPNCPACPMGSTCTSDTDCATGHCVDGVCCDTACTEKCKACVTSGSNKGKCLPVGAGKPDQDTDCDGPDACDGFGNCLLASGQVCATLGQCSTHHCADGVCCNTACAGTCMTCDTGKCLAVGKNKPDPDTCDAATKACNGAGLCLSKIGMPCAAAADCASGQCSDGVCCNVDCSGFAPCRRCNLAGKVGTCSATNNGGACGMGMTCSAGNCQ